MSVRMQRRRAGVVGILAAYLLVLQALIGGLAMGQHAAMGVGLGPNGEVICVNAPPGAEHSAPSGPASSGHMQDCCTSACRIALSTVLPPPAPAALPVRFAARLERAAALPGDATLEAGRRSAHHPRAPPFA